MGHYYIRDYVHNYHIIYDRRFCQDTVTPSSLYHYFRIIRGNIIRAHFTMMCYRISTNVRMPLYNSKTRVLLSIKIKSNQLWLKYLFEE